MRPAAVKIFSDKNAEHPHVCRNYCGILIQIIKIKFNFYLFSAVVLFPLFYLFKAGLKARLHALVGGAVILPAK